MTTSIGMNNHHPPTKATPKTNPDNDQYDILCIGFGPAALAIAIALRENQENHPSATQKRVLFLEKQPEFGWHTGMLLPGSKMQISFMKDLATLRNPRSHFTFVNYLHQKDRLAHFINLSTHMPFREEFNDYMKWCASHFDHWVRYEQEVLSVRGVAAGSKADAIGQFTVTTRQVGSRETQRLSAKHVIVANGGEMAIPESLKQSLRLSDGSQRQIIHSSQYMHEIHNKLPDVAAPYRVAVIGGGQSAVEIYEDVQSRFPNSRASLIFRDSALRPSDDSPFVNEIFDPDSTDNFYALDPVSRKKTLLKNKATNYSVVRLPLIEAVYEKLYRQKLIKPNPRDWTLFLLANREVCGMEEVSANKQTPSDRRLRLQLRDMQTGQIANSDAYDLVIFATGYRRSPIDGILRDLKPLMVSSEEEWVQRNYRLRFHPGSVRRDAGVWMQGFCEGTHGLSDTLLSVLAVRAGEILDSIIVSGRTAETRARL